MLEKLFLMMIKKGDNFLENTALNLLGVAKKTL